MTRLRNFSAAALSRFAVTTASKNIAFMVDSAPEIAELAVDLHEREPHPNATATEDTHAVCATRFFRISAANIGRESVLPKPDRLMADVDLALGQEMPRRCAATAGTSRTSAPPDGLSRASCLPGMAKQVAHSRMRRHEDAGGDVGAIPAGSVRVSRTTPGGSCWRSCPGRSGASRQRASACLR